MALGPPSAVRMPNQQLASQAWNMAHMSQGFQTSEGLPQNFGFPGASTPYTWQEAALPQAARPVSCTGEQKVIRCRMHITPQLRLAHVLVGHSVRTDPGRS